MILWWMACNTAPLDYRDVGVAPEGKFPWAGPTDKACVWRGETDEEIDGFFLCAQDEATGIVPVDDPLYDGCDDPALAGLGGEEFLTAFDGLEARAWRVADLEGRELVHDDWGDEPLLIDF